MNFLPKRLVDFFKAKIPTTVSAECDLCDAQGVPPGRTCCEDCLLELGRMLERGRPFSHGVRVRRLAR